MSKPKPVSAAARVDVVIERITDLWLKRFVDNHPLTHRLKEVGLDGPAILREKVKDQLKQEKPFWDKTAKAIKKIV